MDMKSPSYLIRTFLKVEKLSAICLMMYLGVTTADAGHGLVTEAELDLVEPEESYNSGWQFYFDNDVFLGSTKDRNYTGGIALTLTGRRAKDYWFSADKWLEKLDDISGYDYLKGGPGGFQRHAIEFGLTLFTPDDISTSEAIPDDHPYANLLFMANSRVAVFPKEGRIYQSSLLVGLLGTSVGEQMQKLIHEATDSDEPQGWHNQISDGGELTFKHTLSVDQVLYSHRGDISYELRGGLEAGIGFTTDVRASISGRLGLLNTPWWSFTPHQTEYINLGQTLGDNARREPNPAELFLWAGVKVRYSFYNAILQGQFRDNPVEFSHDQLESVIVNGWLGITKTFDNGLGISFVAQTQTNEIKGPDRKDPVWGGLIISQVF
ncbi:MAG: lipid A deacylase LpxR family protein [Candidatus Thiodiazotropha sp. (ex Monitilora ramsayi)]|nr:lipid A deacylase LpxR family protein [Candidatus Thiodiazotropha sp. (ex Monitilora ramsayi)]